MKGSIFMFIVCNDGRTAVNSNMIECMFVRQDRHGSYCVCLTTNGMRDNEFFVVSRRYINEEEATKALHKTVATVGDILVITQRVDKDEFIFNPTMKQIEDFFNS